MGEEESYSNAWQKTMTNGIPHKRHASENYETANKTTGSGYKESH